MKSIDLRLNTLRRAIVAFRATPGRQGRLVQLSDAEDVLVGGDMHGNVENFRQLLLRADLVHHPRRHLVVQELIHGMFVYPGGGDKSHQMLDLVAALACQFPGRIHFLVGNHEQAQAAGRQVMKYDIDLTEQFLKGVRTAYGDHADEMMALYTELIGALPYAIRTVGNVFLSHSLPTERRLPEFSLEVLQREPTLPADEAPGGALYALVWGRDTRSDHVAAFLDLVGADLLVTGHIPCEEGFARPSPRHVILDTMGSPAAYCLLPGERSITPDELTSCVHLL
ncbi:MAG: metallophosphoesterase [Gemmataceae bacterium]